MKKTDDFHSSHFQKWLATGHAGCFFASHFGQIGGGEFVLFWTELNEVDAIDVAGIDTFVDSSADDNAGGSGCRSRSNRASGAGRADGSGLECITIKLQARNANARARTKANSKVSSLPASVVREDEGKGPSMRKTIEGSTIPGARFLMCTRCGCTHVQGVQNVATKGIWVSCECANECRRWFHESCATAHERVGESGGRYLSGPDWIASYIPTHECSKDKRDGAYLNFTRDDVSDVSESSEMLIERDELYTYWTGKRNE